MKGLLLKDWYMMKKYCRSYLLNAVVFIAVSLVGDNNIFFVFYPCLLCGMIPVTLIAYDERSGWDQYSGTLPYTRAQIVSAKYLIGLFIQITMLTVTALVQGIKLSMTGSIHVNDFIVLLLTLLIMVTLSSSICLPFIFKLGVEKGRIAYYIMVGVFCALSAVASNLFKEDLQTEIRPNLLLVFLALGGIGIYALSWKMSVVFYKKRELH